MADEDLTTYTEVDANARLSESASKCTITGLLANDPATYLYKDYTAGHFTGNFVHKFDFLFSSQADTTWMWGLADNLGGEADLNSANESYFWSTFEKWGATDYRIYLYEQDGATRYNDGYIPSQDLTNTIFYCTARRDLSVGTYGTLYLDIYSDSNRTTLLHTCTLTLHSSIKNFRYIYACANSHAGGANAATGYTENFNLAVASTSPIPTLLMMGVG